MATFRQKAKLLQGLLTGEVADTGPFYVTIDLTRRCNLHCLGCPYHSTEIRKDPSPPPGPLDLSKDLIKMLCSDLKRMGTSSLVFQGEGEPLLHPDILDLILAAKTAGFHVTLLTNGTLLDQHLAREIISTQLDILKVSLWASSPEQYQQNYKEINSENFNNVLEGLSRVARQKEEQKCSVPLVILHHPINRNDYQTLDRMADLALATNCNGLTFAPMYSYRGILDSFILSLDEKKLVNQSLSRIRKQLNAHFLTHNIEEVFLRYKIGADVWEKLPCYIAWFHARIKVDGTVQPCGRCDFPFGNLNQNHFNEIWNGISIRHFRRQTLTRQGLESMSEHCDCSFCCFVGDNMRVHRFFKWLLPLHRHPKKELLCREE
jgi:MoaA/NifB/PqqE/SkfB family radical SAM enzyme